MGHLKINILNQIVDTIKLHFYTIKCITFEEIESFNKKIDELMFLKQLAMEIKSNDSQKRYKHTKINGIKFRVMAQSQNGFNCVLQNGDVSISLLKFSPSHENPVIKVEFRSEYLLREGYKNAINQVKELLSEFLESYVIKISELHLATDIQGYEFNEFDFHRMGASAKVGTVHNQVDSCHHFGKRFTGFSLGKGDEMLRVYNKSHEINQNAKKGFIKVLSWDRNTSYDPMQTVWRIEFQIRRAKLKTLLGKNGLLDTMEYVIDSLEDIWKYFINNFVHKNYSNDQVVEKIVGYKINADGSILVLNKETLRKRFQRAELSVVWDSIQTFEDKNGCDLTKFKEINKPEKLYVINAFKALVSTFVKLNRGVFNSDELTKIIFDADKSSVIEHGMNIVNMARVKALDYVIKAKTYAENYYVTENELSELDEYKNILYENLHDTFAIFENEPANLITFKQFQKRIS